MTTKKLINLHNGVFFITFTCYRWLPLFRITDCYNLVYKWFDVLIEKGHQITGYVIMPNHVHALIALRNSEQSINTLVSNGKRFMAYGIIQRLELLNEQEILYKLEEGLNTRESEKGQLHRVFEHSFDAKLCESKRFIEQKLNYIHNNPCSKRWKLVENAIDYPHSSLKLYENYLPGIKSKITPYTMLFED